MKVFNAFSQVFAIFAFLTIGSLLLIIAFQILTLEDAIIQIRDLYSSPARSFQEAVAAFVFIGVGLSFARTLLKKRNQDEALIYQGEAGPIVVSVTAMEDVVRKVIKKFLLIKDSKTKVIIRGKDIEIKLRLTLWAGAKVQELLMEVQEEIRSRIKKLLGPMNRVEVVCDVHKIEDHGASIADDESRKAIA